MILSSLAEAWLSPIRVSPDRGRRCAHSVSIMKGNTLMPIDLKQFLPYVEHCDLSEEQKLALLEDLRSILSSFVDEAWGLCPTQNFANDNERISGIKPLIPIKYPDADNSNEPLPGTSPEQQKRQR